MHANPEDKKVDPVFQNLIKLSYDYAPDKKDNLVLQIANGAQKTDLKDIVGFYLIAKLLKKVLIFFRN